MRKMKTITLLLIAALATSTTKAFAFQQPPTPQQWQTSRRISGLSTGDIRSSPPPGFLSRSPLSAVNIGGGGSSSSELRYQNHNDTLHTTTTSTTSSSSSLLLPKHIVASTSPQAPLTIATTTSTTDDTEQQQQQQQRKLQQEEEETKKIKKSKFVRVAHLLALNSGVLNAIFLAGLVGGRPQAVGPVTDSWSKLGTALATNDVTKAKFVARILMSFGFGSFTTGLLEPDNSIHYNLMQRTKPLLLAGILVAISAIMVSKATTCSVGIPIMAFQCVSAASGLQNAYTSSWSQNLCRTTHMTGTFTDFCSIAGRCIRNVNNTIDEKMAAFYKYKLKVYGGLISVFCLGGYLGTKWTKSTADVVLALSLSSAFYVLSALPFGRVYDKIKKMRNPPTP